MKGIKQLRGWPGNNWAVVAKYVAVVLVAVVGTSLVLTNFFVRPQDFDVQAEWTNAISRLGIEPTFPPEEDIYVGDVFAVVSGYNPDLLALLASDQRKQLETLTRRSPLGRAIKVYSLPMSAVLDEYYGSTPLFSVTTRKPEKDDLPWTRTEQTGGVFEPNKKRGVLALAAFPDFTIRQSKAAAGSLGVFGSFLGGAWSGDDLIEVKIPLAETYGVPSLVAIALFDKLCVGILVNLCNDTAIREQLTHVAGDLVERWQADPKTNKLKYLLDVELVFVSRVYLARAIEERRVSGVQSNANVAVRKSEKPADTTDDKKPADQALQSNSAGPGGETRSEYLSDNSVVLKRTFERPVVIGYRAVRKKFEYDLNRLNDEPAKPDSPQPKDKP
jgi:hypothetical protein